MSEPPSGPAAPPPKEDPETLVLRGRPRTVVRFRRGLIVGVAGALAVSLVTLSWMALEPPSFRKALAPGDAGEEAMSKTPDALADAPKTYGDVPRLGPPLPGDLGRPILEQERSLDGQVPQGEMAVGPGSTAIQSSAELDRQRTAAARQAARTAALMVQLGSGEPSAAAAASIGSPDASGRADAAAAAAAVPASQQHKIDFVAGDGGSVNTHQLVSAPSPWLLSAGTVIPASLITGLNSDLPGMVLAQVTENVRDSATGRAILVPQGARLIGKYDSVVAFGQRRALLIWSRIIFPDGSSVELDHVPGTDAGGYAGVSDGVDSHNWQLLKGIGMSTLLGVGTQLSFGGGGGLVRALRESAQENAAHAGDQITSKNLDIQPTITVRPGWLVRALVNKDLILEPWRE